MTLAAKTPRMDADDAAGGGSADGLGGAVGVQAGPAGKQAYDQAEDRRLQASPVRCRPA